MRRTRLYVFLSIFSLVVAGGLAVAQKRCNYFKEHRKLTSLFKSDCGDHNCTTQKPTEAANQRGAYEDAWQAMQQRDFAKMHMRAARLKGEYAAEGTRLRAYALRGLGRYDESAKLYTLDAEPKDSDSSDMRHVIDAYIGRAHCKFMMHDAAGAHNDIEKAIGIGKVQTSKYGDGQDHYQLACAYSVQSGMLKGEKADIARRNAIDQLILAIEVGYANWEHIAADLDMDALREDPAFKKLVQ